MRDYHPGRLPFFARRNSHFDQFEFFAGPVTLARPHLRLATFCATILISSSPPFLSFFRSAATSSPTLSLSLLSNFGFFFYDILSHVYIELCAPSFPLDRNDSFHLAMTTFEEPHNSATASRWRMDGRGPGWTVPRTHSRFSFSSSTRDSTSPRSTSA